MWLVAKVRLATAHQRSDLGSFILCLEDFDEFLIVVVQVALKSVPIDQPHTRCAGQLLGGLRVVGIGDNHGFIAPVEGLGRTLH